MSRKRSLRLLRVASLIPLSAGVLFAAEYAAPLARAADCGRTSTGATPLTDLGSDTYQGAEGGLYPGGSSAMPQSHLDAGLAVTRHVGPVDASGRADPGGAYVLLSIGNSNATAEFSVFRSLAAADDGRDSHLVVVDGAQEGKDAGEIVDPANSYWAVLDTRLEAAGVTRQQVQVVWVKEALARPSSSFTEYVPKLGRALSTITTILHDRFPNLRIAYYSSRSYGGYATTDLNPEPYAYWSGFAVKSLIAGQLAGDERLNFDPSRGPVNAPWMAWGPYLWADGTVARSDGLTWECRDFRDDGTHPSTTGRAKVARRLLQFFHSDPTASAWYADRTAPVLSIDSAPPDPSASEVALSFTADDPSATFRCGLDAGPMEPCTSPRSYDGLSDGPHEVSVEAIDAAGNRSGQQTRRWTVDSTAPVVEITSAPPPVTTETSATFSFTADAEDPAFTCSLDGAAAAPCESPVAYADLRDGRHRVVVGAASGERAAVAATHLWTVDTTAPEPVLSSHPAGATNETSATFTFWWNDVSAVESTCSLDGGTAAACDGSASYVDLEPGNHVFALSGTDAAGHTSTEQTWSWTIDTVAPVARITRAPRALSRLRTARFDFASSEPSSFRCSLDGGPIRSCASPRRFGRLADGSHLFAVGATDAAGNGSRIVTHAWTVDATPPTLAIDGPRGATASDSATVTFTTGEPASVRCSLDGAPFAACSSPWDVGPLAEGPHSLAAVAADAAGNRSGTESISWTVDRTAPTVTITGGPEPVTPSTSASFSFTATDATAVTFECSLDDSAATPCASGVTYSDVPGGRHSFSVRPTDAAGNVGDDGTWAWTVTGGGGASATLRTI